MKVAHICGPLLHPAGAERSTVELAWEMTRQGVETKIFTPFLRENLFGQTCDVIEIEQVSLPTLPTLGVYYDLYLTKRLVAEASKWADIAILHSCHAIASYASRRFSIPCVPFYHIDKWDWNIFGHLRSIAPLYTFPLVSFEKKSLRELPLIFATSQNLANRITMHAPGARIVPITIGVDTSRFFPRWGSDEGYVMMSGRFHPMNNFEIGIKAIANTRFNMLIAGLVEAKFDRYYDSLQRLVLQQDGLKERVIFKTLTEIELIDRLQACSLFLSPRRYDYLGHSAMEPMACGKPVVQLSPGFRLEDDPPVLLCDDNVSQWRDAVESLMSDQLLREELGQKSFHFVKEKHSLRASVDQIMHHLTRLTFA